MSNVFITGGSGRVGTCLRQRLPALGHSVRFSDIVAPQDGADRDFTQADLSELDKMARAMEGCDALIHLAGYPREAPWPHLEPLNYTGTHNAFAAAAKAGVKKVIFASSVHYGGLHPADVVLSETLEARPTGLYGLSKVFGETLLRVQAEAAGLTAFAWRICAFKPEPIQGRDLRLWLSWDDAARAADSCLRWEQPGFNILWGVSANTRARLDNPTAAMIGYAPRDDAEDHVARLQAQAVDTTKVSEWSWLGGERAGDWLAKGLA